MDGCIPADKSASIPTEQAVTPVLAPEQVEWVVNDNAELGVKIGDQFFWLYKGHSLVYGTFPEERAAGVALHDDGSPMHWRPVHKREFGECAHPINYADPRMIGTVSLDDGEDWQRLPTTPAEPVAVGMEPQSGGMRP